MTVAPVFICAATRSGTTMLHLMLDSHPHMTNPGEVDFLFDYVSASGELPTVANYLEAMKTSRIFQSKNLNVIETNDYKELIHSFYDQFKQNYACAAFNVHRRFEVIPYLFPEAKYIHIIRDPRDVARSCIGMGWAGNVYYGVDNWIDIEQSWQKLKAKLNPDQYIEIKYESLVLSPEQELSKLCDFCALEYTDEMMSYAESSNYTKPDASLTYQWKRKLSQKDLQLVESKIKPLILANGYELSGFPDYQPSLTDKFTQFLSNKIFRLKFRIDRYGVWLFFAERLTSMLKLTKLWQPLRLKCIEIDKNHLR